MQAQSQQPPTGQGAPQQPPQQEQQPIPTPVSVVDDFYQYMKSVTPRTPEKQPASRHVRGYASGGLFASGGDMLFDSIGTITPNPESANNPTSPVLRPVEQPGVSIPGGIFGFNSSAEGGGGSGARSRAALAGVGAGIGEGISGADLSSARPTLTNNYGGVNPLAPVYKPVRDFFSQGAGELWGGAKSAYNNLTYDGDLDVNTPLGYETADYYSDGLVEPSEVGTTTTIGDGSSVPPLTGLNAVDWKGNATGSALGAGLQIALGADPEEALKSGAQSMAVKSGSQALTAGTQFAPYAGTLAAIANEGINGFGDGSAANIGVTAAGQLFASQAAAAGLTGMAATGVGAIPAAVLLFHQLSTKPRNTTNPGAQAYRDLGIVKAKMHSLGVSFDDKIDSGIIDRYKNGPNGQGFKTDKDYMDAAFAYKDAIASQIEGTDDPLMAATVQSLRNDPANLSKLTDGGWDEDGGSVEDAMTPEIREAMKLAGGFEKQKYWEDPETGEMIPQYDANFTLDGEYQGGAGSEADFGSSFDDEDQNDEV
jgi:hypothetical protein